jgi:hypothetical protein
VPAPGATVAAAFTHNVVRLGVNDKFDPNDAQSGKVPTISSDSRTLAGFQIDRHLKFGRLALQQ